MPIIQAATSEERQQVTLRLPVSFLAEMAAYCNTFGITKGDKPDFSHLIMEAIRKSVLDKERDPKWLAYKKSQATAVIN